MPIVCAVNQVDSNVTGLSYAEEECLKMLPGVDGADAVWKGLEPNSYSDFGGDLKTVARSPINASRQQKKGVVTDLDASGGFNTDVTHSNLTDLMQGFFFADARVAAATQTAATGVVTVAPFTLTDTVAFPADRIPGEWVFLDGASNVGYARIGEISEDLLTLTFDRSTFTPAAVASESTAVYFGTVIRSESDPSLIKRRSYQIERTLGEDNAGTMSEYLIGAVANQFTLNIPGADKLNADLTFVACDNEQRDGTQGVKAGTRTTAPGEAAYNTSSDIYSIRMTLNNDTDPNPQPLFGYVTDGTIVVNNNVTPAKAVGTLGAIDTTAGNFEATGTLTAYFTNVAAVQAVRANADVGFYAIAAANGGAILYDMPLLTLGGGRITVEKDKPVMVPLTPTGAQSKFGHTLLMQVFDGLPDSAMPQ